MTEKDLHTVFSANIKKYRSALRWSQVRLAKETKVSVNFINDLESGKKWASLATMVKLANVFKIDPYELLKPQGSFPESLGSIIKKYTDDIHAALEQARQDFLQDVAAQKKQDRAGMQK